MKRPPYSPAKTFVTLLFFGALVLYPFLRARHPPTTPPLQDYEFGGPTMGTSYIVRIAACPLPEAEVLRLQQGVVDLLADLSRQMSTYDATSEISAFNRATGDVPVAVSADFSCVAAFALALARETGGAFDPTVLPLLQTWGFGPRPAPGVRPSAEAIAAGLTAVGYQHVTVTPDGALQKDIPGAQLDLNALAPGYAVDAMARYLRDHGCANVFVDLSGEVSAIGHSAPGKPWRVAVETPTLDAPVGSEEFQRIELVDRCVATSGDYRNYFEEEGQIFSHVMDPRTGYPVSNGVTSASVLAPDCMTADACATALMVLGADAGLRWIATRTNTDAMLIVRRTDGAYDVRASPGFPR